MPVHKLNDRWLRVIGVPLFAFLATVIFYSDEWLLNHQSFSKCYLSAFLDTLIIWHSNRLIVMVLRDYFPTMKQTFSRVWRQVLLSTIISISLSLFLSWLYDYSFFWGREFTWKDYVYNSIVVLVFVYVAITIYELNFFFREWQNSVLETEKLQKANLQSRFDSLKNQVSPHFLFNSLNTLSSLIEEDQQKAVQFVNQLSKVYRYLLQSNEKELSSLQEELDFVNAYFFLLKTRFDDAISMQVEISDHYKKYFIPPLTLQILVENAVKHNIVSISKPLYIEITSHGENTLFIRNNIQKKTLNVAPSGMGLANISAKYKLLNKPDIFIEETEKHFIVTLEVFIN